MLPRLSERLDDLRSLVLEGLAREGMRTAGKPIGIEPSAYARLVDYEFPGDVAELNVLIQRLVARCSGDAVRVTDMEAIGFGALVQGSRASGGRLRKDPMSA
jgi:DNA-binding NtrC family response regulator